MYKSLDTPYSDLLFAAIDIPMPDVVDWKKQLLSIEENLWFYDAYRTVSILPLRTGTGGTTLAQTENIASVTDFKWTVAAFPDLISYFQKYVFPWTTDHCRIAVLRTPPGGKAKTHIDCSPSAMGTIQHKFRLVVSGDSSTLYYETSNGRLWAPSVHRPFLMDGSWPHGLVNSGTEEKLTICLGSPFQYSRNYPPLLNYISANNYLPPPTAADMFEKKFFTS